MIKTDLLSPTDVTRLIKTFYEKLLSSSIQHHFVGLDLKTHLPKVDAFWNATLFSNHMYATNLIDKHAPLPLKKEEFTIWLQTFIATVDELFQGVNAETIKNRATGIAYIMQKKLLKN